MVRVTPSRQITGTLAPNAALYEHAGQAASSSSGYRPHSDKRDRSTRNPDESALNNHNFEKQELDGLGRDEDGNEDAESYQTNRIAKAVGDALVRAMSSQSGLASQGENSANVGSHEEGTEQPTPFGSFNLGSPTTSPTPFGSFSMGSPSANQNHMSKKDLMVRLKSTVFDFTYKY